MKNRTLFTCSLTGIIEKPVKIETCQRLIVNWPANTTFLHADMAITADLLRDKLVKELAAVHVVGLWLLFVFLIPLLKCIWCV